MHDVIGHALTVSLLHIGSARLALDEDPQEARESLLEAERLARESLDEVRATVGLMRTDHTTGMARCRTPPTSPAWSSRSGAPDRPSTYGRRATSGSLGAARGLAAYRVVQEALTNATRHAAGESVTVRLPSTTRASRWPCGTAGRPTRWRRPAPGCSGCATASKALVAA